MTKRTRKPAGYTKRTGEQREADMLFCSDLFLRGHTYREIATRLNAEIVRRGSTYAITHQMVYYDLRQCIDHWRNERFDNIDDYVVRELAKLDKIESEAWDAWERSKRGRERVKERASKGRATQANADAITTDYYGYNETTAETSAGNPQFMTLALDAMQRRAKLIGYDAAVKIDTGHTKQEIPDDSDKYSLDSVPDEILFALVDSMQDAKRAELLKQKETGE